MNSTLGQDADSYHKFLDYDVVESGDGFVRLEMTGFDRHRNRQDYIHGGVLMSLMDIAGIMAGVRGSGERKLAVTVNLSCNFLSTAMGETVHAEAKIVRKGRSMFFCDCRVVDAATGKLFSTAQGVYKYI
jgi:uncharacterized protein (TIGR00369 family)